MTPRLEMDAASVTNRIPKRNEHSTVSEKAVIERDRRIPSEDHSYDNHHARNEAHEPEDDSDQTRNIRLSLFHSAIPAEMSILSFLCVFCLYE